ncbi:PREDICTED: late secretory pathway protein AVL9-like [Amphimedon queenslandica]|uniref:3CxxC-type domain-containing protein n=2 Tax=Amphimedon queenslandica TaxID=400682 RepID=A0AAN0J3A7_AMPQE|nr:PREDICTED: late secretory pathway protein AVL9-like [Amphimedon queenslandica]|eukprot:XP_019851206.1 PREDICTED: late secretory pathway protein AVL9-like [Amphimedon queenslandica]
MILVSCKNLKPVKRMFGEFCCEKCGREWKSGNAWEGKGQECNKCNKMIYPFELSPLKPPEFPYEHRDPHDQNRCEMCKELGRNCRGLSSYAENLASSEELPPEEDEDNLSVITDTSSALSSVRDRSFSPEDDLNDDDLEDNLNGDDQEDYLNDDDQEDDLNNDDLSPGDGDLTPTEHDPGPDDIGAKAAEELAKLSFNNRKK